MMTSALILAAALRAALAADSWTPAVGLASGGFEVLEAQPVQLEAPSTFIRNGEEIRRSEGVLVRVRVPYVRDFIPRGISGPMFVYGASVCRSVQSPIFSGDAVVLCPVPEKEDREVLWLTQPGAPPKSLRGPRAEAEYRNASKPGSNRAVALRRPPAGAPHATFRDLESLRDEVLERLRKKQPMKQ